MYLKIFSRIINVLIYFPFYLLLQKKNLNTEQLINNVINDYYLKFSLLILFILFQIKNNFTFNLLQFLLVPIIIISIFRIPIRIYSLFNSKINNENKISVNNINYILVRLIILISSLVSITYLIYILLYLIFIDKTPKIYLLTNNFLKLYNKLF